MSQSVPVIIYHDTAHIGQFEFIELCTQSYIKAVIDGLMSLFCSAITTWLDKPVLNFVVSSKKNILGMEIVFIL